MANDTADRAPGDAFAADVVARVADEHGVPRARLETVVADHQRGVRSLPGVDDIVYEWRRTLPRDPLVERLPTAYVLAVEPPVWAEFTDAQGLSAAEAEALRAVHAAQAAATVGQDALPDDDRKPLVLTRP